MFFMILQEPEQQARSSWAVQFFAASSARSFFHWGARSVSRPWSPDSPHSLVNDAKTHAAPRLRRACGLQLFRDQDSGAWAVECRFSGALGALGALALARMLL
jgi:hypothetical protein